MSFSREERMETEAEEQKEGVWVKLKWRLCPKCWIDYSSQNSCSMCNGTGKILMDIESGHKTR